MIEIPSQQHPSIFSSPLTHPITNSLPVPLTSLPSLVTSSPHPPTYLLLSPTQPLPHSSLLPSLTLLLSHHSLPFLSPFLAHPPFAYSFPTSTAPYLLLFSPPLTHSPTHSLTHSLPLLTVIYRIMRLSHSKPTNILRCVWRAHRRWCVCYF